ncbi:MAG: hypothetical protein HY823_08650 [Acidobacteria bacterium]|nr:hypothetical protein [Acidobacteriota bacterium]
MFPRAMRGVLPLALLTAAAGLQAGDLLDNAHFKVRAGYGTGNLRTDLHAERMMGIGFGSAMKFGGGKLTFEANFDYFPGKNWDAMPRSGTFYYNPASPSSTHNNTPVTLVIIATSQASGSTDNRKNWFQGFNLRGGYAQNFAQGWDWQAGLSLDFHRATEEVSGTLYPIGAGNANIPNPNTSGPVQPYYESLATVSNKSKPGFGVYAGVVNQLTGDVRLEANLRSVGYTKLTYKPFTYTGNPARTEETSRMGIVFELAMGIRF